MRLVTKLSLLVAANLVLWPGAYLALVKPAGTSAIPAGREDGRTAGALDQPSLGAILDFSELNPVQAFSRPLFNQNRRAWQPPKPPPAKPKPAARAVVRPAAPPAPPPSVRLVGVSSTGVSDMRALVQFDETAEPVWVLVGDDVQGWTVGSIDAQSITIERGEDRRSFDLYPEVGISQ